MKYSIEQKSQHVMAWQASRLTKKLYCQKQGLSLSSFKNWPLRAKCIEVEVQPSVPGEITVHHPSGTKVSISSSQLDQVLQALLSC